METQPMCSNCDTPLPKDAPEGLCPHCLVRAAFPGQSGNDAAEKKSEREADPTPEEITAQFPQLEVLESFGHGGMGVVYRARQTELDRVVALKILRPASAQDSAFAERFAREAKALAKLNHPNIVIIHDSGLTQAGLYYLMMEFVDGPNLRQVIQSHELSPQQALTIVPQICDALQYAHDQGIVHRDIKPENILLDRKGRVKIADFGLAKMLGSAPGEAGLTKSHQVMGTPRYMAPEQFRTPQEVDHRADIYSLGVVLYEMLTGETPMGRFPPPSQKVHVDVRLDEIVLKALNSEPELRYQHASEVGVDVETVNGDSDSPHRVPGGGSVPPPPRPTKRPRGKWKSPIGCLVTAMLAVAALYGLAVLIALLMPAFQRAGHTARVTREVAKLKQISVALQQYTEDYEGRFPDNLGQLFDGGYITDGSVYVSHSSRTPQPSSGEHVRNGRCDYVYFGKGKTNQTCGRNDDVLATLPGALHGSVATVSGDGTVTSREVPQPKRSGIGLLFIWALMKLLVPFTLILLVVLALRARKRHRTTPPSPS